MKGIIIGSSILGSTGCGVYLYHHAAQRSIFTVEFMHDQQRIIDDAIEVMRMDQSFLSNTPYYKDSAHPALNGNAWTKSGEYISEYDTFDPDALVQFQRLHIILALASRNEDRAYNPLKAIDPHLVMFRPIQLDRIEKLFRNVVTLLARYEQLARHLDNPIWSTNLPSHIMVLSRYLSGDIKAAAGLPMKQAFMGSVHQYIQNRGEEGELAMACIKRGNLNWTDTWRPSGWKESYMDMVVEEYNKKNKKE